MPTPSCAAPTQLGPCFGKNIDLAHPQCFQYSWLCEHYRLSAAKKKGTDKKRGQVESQYSYLPLPSKSLEVLKSLTGGSFVISEIDFMGPIWHAMTG